MRRCALALLLALLPAGVAPQAPNAHLLIVLDGLRPDYVTADLMPNLFALGRRGVVYTNHHAVYPTVTRVNASSIATGAYPERHGILGNSVFFPRVDAARFLDTAQRAELERIQADQDGVLLTATTLGEALQANGRTMLATGAYPERHGILGNSVFFPRVDAARFLDTAQRAELERIQADQDGVLLTATTLGEALQANGRTMLAVGAGTTGAAFLLNHKLAGGAIIHTEYTLPETLHARVLAELGPPPPQANPNDQRNRRAVDAFFTIGLPTVNPSVSAIWLSDPDTTAHALGMGHPTTLEAIRRLDREIKRIQDGLAAARLLDKYNIWVTSDHGFATYTGAPNVSAVLKGTVSGSGAVHVRDGNRQAVAQIVRALQKTAGVGAIFTRSASAGSLSGWADGTLSFDAARWTHARSGDILYSPDWTDHKNAHGVPGTSASNGVAGHGSSSPFEIHNTLIAAGPDIKQGVTLDVPSGNVDFAPTFLRALGIAVPQTMQGRPLVEAFRGALEGATPTVTQSRHTARTADGSYAQTAHFSIVRAGGVDYRYLDYTAVTRTLP